ncbi:uncharacterized protein LOC126675003 isoform X2 [Mercurialis annua]|nr:uncharacterized protein LOC126675003 isoform X2 [Mercurialis annua]XP_050225526.1 uncharacterized protein LOC126675003 isoform X2 [Mercurialis annua]
MSTCSQCGIISQHIYCMRTSCGEVPQLVPNSWTCKDGCCTEDEDRCDENGEDNLQTTENTAVHRERLQQGGPTKASDWGGHRFLSRKAAKVKYISPEEAAMLPSGPVNIRSPLKNNLGRKPVCSSGPPKQFASKIKQRPSYISFGPERPSGLGRNAGQPSRTLKELKATISPAKEHTHTLKNTEKEKNCSGNVIAKEVEIRNANAKEAVHRSSASVHRLPPNIRSDSCRVAESKKPEAERGDLLADLPNLILYYPHFPALNVIWKGGFKFTDAATPGEFYGGLQAHPASRVSRKAYELTQKMPMPIILQIELLQRQHVWADVFLNDHPDFHDIALYFHPSGNIERSKENFTRLFERMEIQNLVLRCYISDVELLIFTSKQLDQDSQDVIERLGMRQFLWGGFLRRTKRDQSPSDFDRASLECNDTIDMEIDMMGGKLVGRIDTVVPRESLERARGQSDKKAMDEYTMRMSNTSSAFEDVETQQLRLESEQAQSNLFSFFSEPSAKITTDLASMNPLQSLVEKLSAHTTAMDVPPGFKDLHKKVPVLRTEGGTSQGSEDLPKKVCVPTSEVDIPQVFKDSSRQNLRNKLREAKVKEEPDSNDARAKGIVQKVEKDTDSQSCPVKVKSEIQKFDSDHRDLGHRLNTSSPGKRSNVAFWSPPPTDWVKLNVAGHLKANADVAGAGGIIRDESGKWLQGFTVNLGTETSGPELWAVFKGLELAWKRGYRKVVVETESHMAVEYLMKSTTALDSNRNIVECCWKLIKLDWDCHVLHVDRNANLSASWLAAQFGDRPLRMNFFSEPPNGLVSLLQNDSLGISRHSSPTLQL